MRLSVLENDPGFQAERALRRRRARVTVTLGGCEVRDCITADEEQGFVIIPATVNGKRLLDKKTGEFLTTALVGPVKIEVGSNGATGLI